MAPESSPVASTADAIVIGVAQYARRYTH